jgi:hypothetical protein
MKHLKILFNEKRQRLDKSKLLRVSILLLVVAVALAGLSTIHSHLDNSSPVGCKQYLSSQGVPEKVVYYRKVYGYPFWFLGNSGPSGTSWAYCYTLGEPVPQVTPKTSAVIRPGYLVADLVIWAAVASVILFLLPNLVKPSRGGKRKSS